MRKLILSTIAALSLGLASNGCLENRLERDIPIKPVDITQEDIQEGAILSQTLNLSSEGFSHFGITAINLAENQVFKKYNLPLINYLERNHTNKLTAIAGSSLRAEFPGLPKIKHTRSF